MFSIAQLIDRAKARTGIESDYKLAQTLGVTRGAVSQYQHGKILPDDRVITLLCEMSGDDAAVIAAEIQAERAKTEEGKTLWRLIAERLRHAPAVAASWAIFAVCFAILSIAPSPSVAGTLAGRNSENGNFTSDTSYKVNELCEPRSWLLLQVLPQP